MNWLLLILGGFFEVGFATCLGKAKESSGTESILLVCRLFILLKY
jgi:quaternary ammonium compound-resistance protein SugE